MVKTVSTHISLLEVKFNTRASIMESDLKVMLIVMDHIREGSVERKRENESIDIKITVTGKGITEVAHVNL